MPSKKTPTLVVAVLIVASGFLTAATPAFAASTEKVLYSFCSLSGCTDGSTPGSGLILDGSGNLYGTTTGGGANGWGTVFRLVRRANSLWTENVLYSFCSESACTDGAVPQGNLILDEAGNLYGVTDKGGSGSCGGNACGIVFELSPDGGKWSEKVLHNFDEAGVDGFEPIAGLTLDAAGNLYGTTYLGGAHGKGTVFELTPGSNGTWTETVIHSFCSVGSCKRNGQGPVGGLILGDKGSLYGTTTAGGLSRGNCGAVGCGVVFQLTFSSSGKWKENVLLNFNTRDGSDAALTFDPAENLYGTTPDTVFELKKNNGWAKKVLHTFGKGKDGATLDASVAFDGAGNLYGTTLTGGANRSCSQGVGCGTVFRLRQQGNGKWTEGILHSFNNNGKDGTFPVAGVIVDPARNVYGTTSAGGASGSGCGGSGCGTVFEITP